MMTRWLNTLLVSSALAASAAAQTVFTAQLEGGQEVPVAASANTGTGSFLLDPFSNALTYNITVTGLTGGLTGAHIHTGNAGANGGIAFNLAGGPSVFSGSVSLSPAQVTTLRNSGFYANIHSSTFPNGEMRGQINPGRDQYIVVMSGAKEVPPVPSPAVGSGTLNLNGANQVAYDITFSGLTGAFTASHIHDGFAGANGGILFNLTQMTPGNLLGTTGALTAAQRAKLRSGGHYVNVHSSTFGSGEIRGQTAASFLPYGSGCAHPGGSATLSGSGITRPGGNISISVQNGVNSFGIMFVSIAGFNGSIGFGCPLLVHPSAMLSITLPLPPGGSLTLPATLPGTLTAGTAVNMQYIGDKGGGVPYATNGLQMLITN